MAGRGPTPKEHHQRERDTRRRQGDATTVAADGVLRGPDLPEAIKDPHPETVEWWATWRRSPQAQLFADTDWESLKRAALLQDALWKSAGRPSAAAVAELRLIEERYGATFVDRQRAKIRIERPGDVPAESARHNPTASRASIASRMKGSQAA